MPGTEHSISVGIAIPTLNAENLIGPLIETLKGQTQKLNEILVIDSSSDDKTARIAKEHGAKVAIIPRKEFNHGLTRHKAVLELPYDYVLFMTQDALPTDNRYVENIIAPLIKNENIAIASGRQIAKPGARRFEQLVREFNYPKQSFVRSKKDLERLGIKTFFSSDVCSAYRRETYLELGGFGKCNTSEDMLMAARSINSGFSIAYVSDASVYHSHNLSLRQQFTRNAEIGYFLQKNKNMLKGTSELGEGKNLFIFVSSRLLHEGKFWEFVRFTFDCVARLLGNRFGRSKA